jgi:hypothetical protein
MSITHEEIPMTKRERRDTANDIFRNNQHTFYPKKVSFFEEAYPEIEDIQIEVNETGESIYEKNGSHSYRKENLRGPFIDCSNNPPCYGGGFEIDSKIREMIASHVGNREYSGFCRGYESSAQGKNVGKKCFNHFEVRISITYKNNMPNEQAA